MKTTDYLDAIKARHDLPSDYALAKLIGCARSGISGYRAGKTTFDDSTARRVAELLDLDPVEVAIAAHAERAKSPEDRALWERAFVRLAVERRTNPPESGAGPMCIMSTTGQHRRRWDDNLSFLSRVNFSAFTSRAMA